MRPRPHARSALTLFPRPPPLDDLFLHFFMVFIYTESGVPKEKRFKKFSDKLIWVHHIFGILSFPMLAVRPQGGRRLSPPACCSSHPRHCLPPHFPSCACIVAPPPLPPRAAGLSNELDHRLVAGHRAHRALCQRPAAARLGRLPRLCHLYHQRPAHVGVLRGHPRRLCGTTAGSPRRRPCGLGLLPFVCCPLHCATS